VFITTIGALVAPNGTVTVNEVGDAAVTVAFVAPKLTTLLAIVVLKLEPVIVIDAPGVSTYELTFVITGGLCEVTVSVVVALDPQGLVTVYDIIAEPSETPPTTTVVPEGLIVATAISLVAQTPGPPVAVASVKVIDDPVTRVVEPVIVPALGVGYDVTVAVPIDDTNPLPSVAVTV
jgi:hypothetical protein